MNYFLIPLLVVSFTLCAVAESTKQPEPEVFSWALPEDISGTPFESVAARLRSTPAMRASFVQNKWFPGSEKPIVATGDFLLGTKEDEGLSWKTKTPLPMTLVVTRDFIAIRDHKGKLRRIGSAMAHLRGYADVMLAMFSADVNEIRSFFDVYFGFTNNTWIIGLKPKEKRLQKLMSHATLSGRDTIEGISFLGPKGDRTEFVFSDIFVEPTELSEEEAAIFIEK
ncbi:MAG: hypothetical protein ACI8W8_002749 [Rhodothermales bacterium]|jgi:hypothetical protein